MTKATGQSGSDRARKEAQGAPVSGVLTKPEAEREVAVARAGQIKPAGQAAEECAAPQFVKLSTAESETLARRLDLATSLFVGSMNETYTEQSRGHLRQMLELVCTGQVKTAWGMHRVTSLREGMPEADFETLGARFEPAIARPSERNDAITEQLLKTGWQWVVDEAAAKGEVTFFKPGVIRGPRHGELTATGSVFFDPAVAREARSGEGNKADVVKVTGNVTGFYFRSEVIDDPARLEPSTDNKKDRKDREDEGAITDELVTYFEAKNLPRELWEPTAAEIERVIRKQGVANPDWDGGGHVGDVVRYFECGGITTLGGLQLQGPNVGGQTRATLISEFAGLNTGGASALAWNYSSGGGETDWFINRDGGGIGGLNIYDFPDTSGSPTNIFTLTGAGNLTIPGTVTGAASYWTGSVGIGTAAPTTALQVNGTVTAALFSGSGIGLTGISTANLSATGTANSTTYLRGDNTWASVSGGSLPALTNGDIWVGNGSNVASAVAISGDVSLTNAGATTVGKIQGTSITGTTGTGKVVLSASPSLTGTVSASTGFSAAGSAGVSSVPTPQTGSSGICMGGSLSFIFVGGLITNINTDDSNCATNNPDNGGGDLAEYYGTQGERPERGDIVALADQTNSFDLKIRNPSRRNG